MNRFEAAVLTAETPAIQSLDYSMFSERDIANVALQRPEVLEDIDGHRAALAAWKDGNETPLTDIAARWRLELVTRAVAFVAMEYRDLRPLLQELAPRRIADIGCGYGFFDLFAHAEFGAEMVLIDTEVNSTRRALGEDGMGRSSLPVARRFLVANGCDATRLTTVNPRRQDVLTHRGFDLAVSFLSCGYLFPCVAYRDFFQHSVNPGGSVLLDLRVRQLHEVLPGLTGLGRLRRVSDAADGVAMRMQLITSRNVQERAA